MRLRLLELWGLVALLICIGCGGSSKKNEVSERLVAVREQLEQIAQQGVDDPLILDYVSEARSRLEEADHLMIEDDFSAALAIVKDVAKEAEEIISGGRQATGNELAFGSGSGLVRVDSGSGMQQLTSAIKPSAGMVIETGVRSSLKINLFSGSGAQLGSNSRLNIDRIKGRELSLSLESGTFFLVHRSGTTQVAFRDHTFQADKLAVFEMASATETSPDYTAAFSGTLTWSGGGIEGTLMTSQALTWVDGARAIVDIPSAPIQDAPANNRMYPVTSADETLKVNFEWHSRQPINNYQFQVAKTNRFENVVHESKLENATTDVTLSAGSYFWRIRAIADSGIPGSYSPVSQFRVEVQEKAQNARVETGPPILNPKIEVFSDSAIVSGKSNREVTIMVNGVKAVMMEDGTFKVIVSFKRPGTQWVEIVARDSRGGETVSRHKVEVQY